MPSPRKDDHIAAQAAAVFCAEGFAATGIERVRAQAAVSTRTMYRHFASREGLVLAAVDWQQERFLAYLAENAPQSGAPALDHLFTRLQAWLEATAASHHLSLRARDAYPQIRPLNDKALAHLGALYRLIQERLARCGVEDAAKLAPTVLGNVLGAMAMAAIFGPAQAVAAARAGTLFNLGLVAEGPEAAVDPAS